MTLYRQMIFTFKHFWDGALLDVEFKGCVIWPFIFSYRAFYE